MDNFVHGVFFKLGSMEVSYLTAYLAFVVLAFFLLYAFAQQEKKL